MPDTCTVPGHPECTITCEHGGCIAVYDEELHKCRTGCGSSIEVLDISEMKKMSICITGVPGAVVCSLLAPALPQQLKELLEALHGTVSLSLQSADTPAVLAELERIASR